jgi:hypothetical protein
MIIEETLPEVGSLSLFKQRIKVDFPLPDKPIKQNLTFHNFKANIIDPNGTFCLQDFFFETPFLSRARASCLRFPKIRLSPQP